MILLFIATLIAMLIATLIATFSTTLSMLTSHSPNPIFLPRRNADMATKSFVVESRFWIFP